MQALGSAPCIDALRLDVATIQKVVIEVVSRVGGIPNVQSWKFTNQNASEVDVTRLLQRYKHTANGSNPETNAVVHVVLLELVIDRLLFLMQAVERHLAGTLSSLTVEAIAKDTKLLSSPLSTKYKSQIAAATQQFWMRVMSTTSALQTLSSIKSAPDESEATQRSASSGTRAQASTDDAETQTDDDNTAQVRPKTAVSCSCAAQTHDLVQPLGKEVAALCRQLGLASSTSQQRPLSASGAAAMGELKRLQADMMADLQHVAKAVKELQQRAASLQECKQRAEELRAEVEHVRCEIDEQRHDYNKKLNDLSGKLQQLTKLRDELQKQLRQKTLAVEEQHSTLGKLRSLLQSALQLGADSQQAGNPDGDSDVQSSATQLVRELTTLRDEQLQLQQQVCVEQVRCRSLQQQNSALIHKQQTLLTQYELLEIEKQTLSAELERRICDALTSQKRTETEQHQKMNDTARKAEQRIAELEAQVRDLMQRSATEHANNDLQQELQRAQGMVQELEEKLALVVQYPDVVTRDMIEQHIEPNSSDAPDDVASAMIRQLDANTVRISLLQHENAKLSRSVTKLNQTSGSRQAQHEQSQLELQLASAHLAAPDRPPISGLRRNETELEPRDADHTGYRLPAVSTRRLDPQPILERAETLSRSETPVVQLWSLPTTSNRHSTGNDFVPVPTVRTLAADTGAKPPAPLPDRTRTYRVSSAVAITRTQVNVPARPTTTVDGAARQYAVLNDVVIGPGKHTRKSSARPGSSRPDSALK